ncbi:MAG TPA: class II fumarate hydratase [Thermoplasmata archaeon]|nr:class II fumarate hydratase [Thermoplasmata archaeon]
MADHRTERDTLGEVRVPADALWGASTQRAIENFPISGIRFPRVFLEALGLVKWACAEANAELGLLDRTLAEAIAKAAEEVAAGSHDDQFPLDVFQTGSGTSTNTNANEVIANLANVALGGPIGAKKPVHPNDHVNMGQSSNDVIPTAIHVAALLAIDRDLVPALERLRGALSGKATSWDGIVKSGRTHLMDATPIRLGQEFSGYASQVDHGIARVRATYRHLAELALGGTAVGTGINAHPDMPGKAIRRLAGATGLPLVRAPNAFEAQAAQDALVETSGALRTVAVGLFKIADDIRLMGSGPRTGLAELKLPELQPGSSIMPGKVNPVIPEAVIQVCAQVLGNDAAVAASGLASHLDLSTMMPVMCRNLLESVRLLARASEVFRERCIEGLQPNLEKLSRDAELSTAIVTRLSPIIGYDRAAELAKESMRTGKTVKELVAEKGILSREDAERLLDPKALTEPSKEAPGSGVG